MALGARRRVHIASLCATIGALAGCTTSLNAVRVTDAAVVPTAGAPYSLNFSQFEITITRRLKACFDEDDTPKMIVAVLPEIKRLEVPDPKRQYVIDLDSMQSFFKKTNLEIEYHPNGILKSINSAAEDRSAEVVGSVTTTFGKIAIAAAGAGGLKPQACKRTTRDLLKKIEDDQKALEAVTKEVEALTAEVDRLTAIGSALGKAWGEEDRQALASEIDSLHEARRDVIVKGESLKGQLKKISDVVTVTWPLDGETFLSDGTQTVREIDEDLVNEWGSADRNSLVAQTAVWLKLDSPNPLRRKEPCGVTCADDVAAGLKYRVPVQGRLLVCTASTCDEAKEEVIGQNAGPIPQLGHVFTLPLKSGLFSDKSVTAAFSEAGTPTKIGIKTNSVAEKGASTLGGVVDQVLAVRDKTVTSKMDRIKAETELLKAQKGLADAEKALEPPMNEAQAAATEAFQADAALAKAELASIEAHIALEAAKKQVSP